jgi:hypothetical protein
MPNYWTIDEKFVENQSKYLEIARRQFNPTEYALVKKQYKEGLHPESKKYNEDEEIIKSIYYKRL